MVAVVLEHNVALKELDERVLRYIAGRFDIVEHAARQAEDRVSVLVDSLFDKLTALQAFPPPFCPCELFGDACTRWLTPIERAALLSNTFGKAKAQRESKLFSKPS